MRHSDTLCRFLVVVPHRNGTDRILACMSSVLAAAGPRDRIVLIDNASTDDSARHLSAACPNVMVLTNPRNRGFAGACNQGSAVCDCEFVLFLNSDALVPADALDILESFFRMHPEAGQAGVRLIGEDGRQQRASAPAPCFWSELGLRRRVPRGYRDPQHSARVDVLVGACVVLPKPVLERIGGWDERFFFYEEDVDLSVRVGRAGYEVWYLPEISVTHLKGASTRSMRLPARLEALRSRFLYVQKHFPLWQQVLLLPARVFSLLLNTLGSWAVTLATLGLYRRGRQRAFLHTMSLAWLLLLMRPRWSLSGRT